MNAIANTNMLMVRVCYDHGSPSTSCSWGDAGGVLPNRISDHHGRGSVLP